MTCAACSLPIATTSPIVPEICGQGWRNLPEATRNAYKAGRLRVREVRRKG